MGTIVVCVICFALLPTVEFETFPFGWVAFLNGIALHSTVSLVTLGKISYRTLLQSVNNQYKSRGLYINKPNAHTHA